jgi:uncharacterized damage-inducible protein DinB
MKTAAALFLALSMIGQAEEKLASGYELKAQALLDLQQLQSRFTELAGAMPGDKLTWRPAEGVRSIADVYLHVAAANYGFPIYLGAPAKEGFSKDPKESGAAFKSFEKSTADKDKIIEKLNASFDYARQSIDKLTDADWGKPVKEMGPEANMGDVVYLLVTHAHEHLGQSIAYARENGVIPPWTAKAMMKKGAQPQE